MADSTRAASAPSEPTSGALRVPSRRALVLAAGWLVLLVALVSWLVFLWRALHAPVGEYDFSSFYAAGLALRLDPHADIYSNVVLAAAGARGRVQVQPPLPYTYPPLAAILLSPFTLLSFRVAARVWLAVNAGLALVTAAILAREIAQAAGATTASGTAAPRLWLSEPLRLSALALAAAITLAAAPVRQTLLTGQVDLLVLLPLALVPWLLRARRDAWAGAAVGLAAMLKLTPGLLLLYFILRGRWRAFWAAVITLVVLALVSMVIVGPGTFFAALPQALRVGSGDAGLGQNEALLAPIAALITTAWPAAAFAVGAGVYLVLAALALALGWLIWRAGRGQVEQDVLAYGVALCGLLLVVPTAWVHHYVWVLPALAIAFGVLGARALGGGAHTRSWAALAALLVLAAVLIDMSLPHAWDTDQHPAITTLAGLPLRSLLLEARALGTLLLAALLASMGYVMVRTRRPGPAREEAV